MSHSNLNVHFCSINKDELFEKSRRTGAFAFSANFRKKEKVDDVLTYIPEAPFISLLSRHLKNWSDNEQNCDSIYHKNLCNKESDNITNGHELNHDNNNASGLRKKAAVIKTLKNGFVNADDKAPSDEDDFVLVELVSQPVL